MPASLTSIVLISFVIFRQKSYGVFPTRPAATGFVSHLGIALFTDCCVYVPSLRASQRDFHEFRQSCVPQDYGGSIRSGEKWLRTR